MKKKIVAVALIATLASASSASAESADGEGWASFGLGVAAVALNVLYVPAKLCYAAVGGIFGALALGVTAGNQRAAEEVWSPTLGGDYVVTSKMLRGDSNLRFVGPSYSGSRQSD